MIDAFATSIHYHDHIAPIMDALGEDRGTFHVNGRGLSQLADGPGYDVGKPDPRGKHPVICASYGDMQQCWGRPIIYMEHGCGAEYPGTNPGYAGGHDRDRVVLMLDPNDHTRNVNARAHPSVPGAVIGFPILDSQEVRERTGRTVVLSAHWDNKMWPAARSAWDHYRSGMPQVVTQLQTQGWEVLGHGHPRAMLKAPRLVPFYESVGIEVVHDFDEALDRADVWVCDNSSSQFLSAALGVRQVVMDAPWHEQGYREGLWPRFTVPFGVRVTDAAQIPTAVELAPVDDVSEVVPFVGGAAERAVQAIRAYVLRS